jgi:hypothetical protein
LTVPHTSYSKIFFLALPIVGTLLWLGVRNRPDPVWLEMSALLHSECCLLDEAADSLQLLYCNIQNKTFSGGERTALDLVSQPSLPNIEWGAFRDLTKTAFEKRFLVVAGVTGAGSTKQTKRAARLIASGPDHILGIDCAPQFDLEYHKKYIGTEENGGFAPGLLLRFWERCHQNPGERFVAVVDNFDKINPETFFGPALWEALGNARDTAVLGGIKRPVPANFYLLSVTHLGPGSIFEFNEEHFKRLGRQYVLKPNPRELLAIVRSEMTENGKTALDSAQLHQFLYYFAKTNALIRKRYADGYQLGQGSNLKNLYRPEQVAELKQTYLNHINALQPERPLTLSDFDALDFTVKNGGREAGSNFISRQIQYLQDTGYLVEITMVGGTALLTFLIGWWVFRRREQLIRRYGDRTQQIFSAFEKQSISAEAAARRLEEIKKEVDALVMRRKLNYTEGLYFLAFIEDKVRRIDFARNVSENFLELFSAFMEDGILNESEYQKLRQFLQSIRHKIPNDVYEQFSEKVERAYAASL